MIKLDQTPVPVPTVVGRVLESQTPGQSEAVLVLPDKGQVKVLNEVGARIWSLVDGRRSAGEIAALLCAEYAVDLPVAQEDTLAFLADLAERGILTLQEGPLP